MWERRKEGKEVGEKRELVDEWATVARGRVERREQQVKGGGEQLRKHSRGWQRETGRGGGTSQTEKGTSE